MPCLLRPIESSRNAIALRWQPVRIKAKGTAGRRVTFSDGLTKLAFFNFPTPSSASTIAVHAVIVTRKVVLI